MPKKNKKDAVAIVQSGVDSAVRNYVNNIGNIVRHMLDNAVAKLIGLNKRSTFSDEYELTGGGLLSSYLINKAKDAFHEVADRWLDDTAAQLIQDKRAQALAVKKFKEGFMYAIEREMREAGEQFAKDAAGRYVESLQKSLEADEGLLKSVDLEDPDSFHGEMGELIFEELASGHIRYVRGRNGKAYFEFIKALNE